MVICIVGQDEGFKQLLRSSILRLITLTECLEYNFVLDVTSLLSVSGFKPPLDSIEKLVIRFVFTQ